MSAIYLEEEINHRISVCIGMPFESLQAIVIEHDLERTGSVGITQSILSSRTTKSLPLLLSLQKRYSSWARITVGLESGMLDEEGIS